MTTERLELGQTLAFESVKYGVTEGYAKQSDAACFEFTEHSPDAWYSDSETSVPIDAAMAQKIIAALTKHFEFKPGVDGEPPTQEVAISTAVLCQGLRDDEIAKLVNEVTQIARTYHDHGSLRQRIAGSVLSALKPRHDACVPPSKDKAPPN